MKVGCVYYPRLHSGCGKFHFIADALRSLGHDVTHIQTNKELEAADEFCDFVLFEQRCPALLNIPDFLKFAKRRKSLFLQWFFDLNVFDYALPMAKQAPLEACMEFTQAMDLVFVKEQDWQSSYHDAGIRTAWLDQGCPSAMRQAELQENSEFDVILWGSASRPMWRQRWEDVETLVRAGFKVAWATGDGNLPPGVHRLPGCQPLELPDLIERAKVTLVVDACQEIRGYWSDRIWLAAGAGACCVRRLSLGGGHLPAWGYASGEMLVPIVSELCADWRQRRKNGSWARERTMKFHNYESRVLEIIEHVQTLREQRPRSAHLQAV